MASSRDAIVRVAKSYLGVHGGSSAHADIIHIFNTVKPFGYTAKTTDYWCAEFASACAIQAYGKKIAVKYFPLSAACLYMINKAKQMNIWVESDKYIPAKGDFILYDWDDGTNYASTDNKNGNVVRRRTLPINGRYIRGFVTPDYESIKVKKTPKTTTEVVKEVLSGEWGTGSTRKKALTNAGYDYDVIQAEVNRIVKLTNETLDNKYGVGKERVNKLGKDYDLVQWNINRIYKEKEKDK